MQTRRSLRLVAGALVLALPLLGSCGFGKATDRPNTQAAGINHPTGDVKVLSAVIVAAQPNSGTFVASLSNSLADEDFEFTGLAGSGEWSDLEIDPADPSIPLPARGFVNLVNQDPITVTGEFEAGEVAELTLTFDSGDTVTMDVPIVFACNTYNGLDPSQQQPEESEPETAEPSPGDVPTDGTTVSPTEDESESPASGAAAEPYNCALDEG